MKSSHYSPRSACFATLMLLTCFASLATAQERVAPPPPENLPMELASSATEVRAAFERGTKGLAAAIGSTHSAVQRIHPELPPILADAQAVDVFLVGEGTKYVLRRWSQVYFAQFVLLDFSSGRLGASHVLMILPQSGSPDDGSPPADDVSQDDSDRMDTAADDRG